MWDKFQEGRENGIVRSRPFAQTVNKLLLCTNGLCAMHFRLSWSFYLTTETSWENLYSLRYLSSLSKKYSGGIGQEQRVEGTEGRQSSKQRFRLREVAVGKEPVMGPGY